MAALRGAGASSRHASATSKSGRVQRSDVRAHAALLTQRVALPTASTGLTFSPIINGCWQLAGGHGREVFDNIEDKLWAAADAGFTSFDTADIYGPSEQIVGKFQRRWAETSGKPPVQVFTKYVPNVYNARPTPALVEAAVRRSLNALQVPRLDLVQLHWWEYSVAGLEDTALALAELQARGLVAAVGTTNMNVAALARIEDAGVRLASNQVQFSLLDRRPLNGMLQYCQARGIKLLTYGSVGGGLLSDKFAREQPKTNLFGKKTYAPVDLNTSSLKMYWNIVKGFGGQELWRDLLTALRQVADKHGASVANVALRWVMQQGDGATVFPIVGLRGTSHLADNARTLALQLDAQDLAAVQAVLDRAEGPEGDIYSFERGE